MSSAPSSHSVHSVHPVHVSAVLPESDPSTGLVTGQPVARYRPCTSAVRAAFLSKHSWIVGVAVLRLVAGLTTLAAFIFLLPRLAYEDHKDHDSYSAMVAAAMSFKLDGIPLLPTLFQTVGSMATLNFLSVVAQNRLLPADQKVAAQAAVTDIAAQGLKVFGIWYTIAASMQKAPLPTLLSPAFAMLNAMFFASMLPEVALEAVRLYNDPSWTKAAAFALTLGLLATGSAFLCAQQNYAFGFAAGSCVGGLFLLVCKQALCAAKGSADDEATLPNRSGRAHSASSLNTVAAAAAAGPGARPLTVAAADAAGPGARSLTVAAADAAGPGARPLIKSFDEEEGSRGSSSGSGSEADDEGSPASGRGRSRSRSSSLSPVRQQHHAAHARVTPSGTPRQASSPVIV